MAAQSKKRNGRILAGAAAGLLLVVLGLGTWNTLRPLPPLTVTTQAIATTPEGAVNLSWPSAQAAVGATDFGVLATQGAQTPRPTASIAKAITSLAVLERLPLKTGETGPIFTVTAADVARYDYYVSIDGSVAKVTTGEQLTEYQALQALMLPSANNVADSLAVWAFGSMDAYHTYANEMVKRLGMNQTTVGTDASGMSPKTVSTAADLVKLGEAALRQPVFAEIVAQESAVLPVAGTVYNVDWLLGQEGIKGIKTGTTDEAGGCFLGAATHTLANGDKTTVISAVLGAKDRNTAMNQTLPLLRSVKDNLDVITPVKAGQVLGTYALPWGGTVKAVADKNLSILAWSGNSRKTDITLQNLRQPSKNQTAVGKVAVTTGAQTKTVDAVLETTMPQPSFWWRLTRH